MNDESNKKNLQLRTEILDIALSLEENVNLLLLRYLSIERKERKALTNKSGNLSFKNKIDLLFDLEIFDKEEYQHFLLIMEYRNQFLHNIDCNSFTYATDVLGKDKKQRLLKFTTGKIETGAELVYKHSFNSLYVQTLKIVQDKLEKRKQLVEERREPFSNITASSVYIIDTLFAVFEKLFEQYDVAASDSEEVMQLKTSIFETIAKEIENIDSTEEYRRLRSQLNNSFTPEKLKRYFK